MSSQVVFHDVADAVQARLEAYWAGMLPRLQRLLARSGPDLRQIDLAVFYHPPNAHRARYEARAAVHLPTGTLAARANDPDPEVALDRVAHALTTGIKRHKEQARKDDAVKRKARWRAALSAAGPLLQRYAEGERREDFVRKLQPLLGFLAGHARRELRGLELAGRLHRREVRVADVLDAVLALAWERFKDRPPRLSPDLWLTHLLHAALEQLVKQEPRPHLSLEEKADEVLPDRAKGDEPEWWADVLGEEEAFTLEDLIPGSEWTDVLDQLEAEEQRDRLLSLLGELPAAQRQAFLLHALQNYTAAEIAQLQDRPESEVKADIEAARQTLRERLLAAGDVRATAASAARGQTVGTDASTPQG